MVLYRSLLQDDIFTSGTSESDPAFLESKVFLAKCTRTSLMVIKAAPRIASSLPPSHYLLDYSQQLLVSGGESDERTKTRLNAVPSLFQITDPTRPSFHLSRTSVSRIPCSERMETFQQQRRTSSEGSG